MRILAPRNPSARLSLARRLLDCLEAAGDQLRRHAAAKRCFRPIRRSRCRSSRFRSSCRCPGSSSRSRARRPKRARGGRSPRARRAGERRGARAADPRRLHQRHPGLSLLGRRALPGLCRARRDHRHRARSRRAACRLRARSPPATPCAGSSATPRAEPDAAKQVHILVKPTRPDLVTNLVINTDRRTYHLELRSAEKTYMASVSWAYAAGPAHRAAPAERGRRGGGARRVRRRHQRAELPLPHRGRQSGLAAAARLR